MNTTSQLESIFFAALEKPPADRAAFLDEVCGDDRELRGRLERMISAHDKAGAFLEQPAIREDITALHESSFTDLTDTTIGPYKLLQQIGEGGMGVVFMAEQSEPIQRTVALKIIKPGMDTRQVIARFEAERQALALMDHPNIARVLDAGMTVSGHPFFVMDLVKGVPITEYCDQQHLSIRERLGLMAQVCHAVQHAHQKGIIHRDIKPSNVLIAEYDGKAVPKVIDFGVSKATAQKLTEKTMFTEYGQLIGTFEYMSPEQARFNQLDVDTRSDIYSLGVLLYELLTGSTPLDRECLRSAAFDEILRMIGEEEPPKPSTRLSSSEALSSISARRHSEPAKLTNLVRGELDWIVMKCLEKDRNRRYETASSFAADIERHLQDQAVQAGPPSTAYRFRKIARRNKAALMASSVIAAALFLGLIGTTWQAIRATRAEHAAQAQRDRALKAEKLAKTESERASQEAANAKTEAAIATSVSSFLNRDLLGQMDLYVPYDWYDQPWGELKLATVLDRAAAQLEGRFAGQPLVEAALRQTIGETYSKLGHGDRAVLHLQRAVELRRTHLGEEHPDTLASKAYLGWAAGNNTLITQVLDVRRRVLGTDHADTLQSMFDLAFVTRSKGEQTHDKVVTARAIALFREALAAQRKALGEDHYITAWTMHVLARTLFLYGGKDGIPAAEDREIEALYRQSLAVSRKVRGDSWHTYDDMMRLGEFLSSRHRYDEAEAIFQDAIKQLRALPGADPKQLAIMLHMLANSLTDKGDLAAAEPVQREALAIVRNQRGDDDLVTAGEAHDLAYLLVRIPGREAEAEQLFREALRVRRKMAGVGDVVTADTAFRLAQALGQRGKFDEADNLLLEAYTALVANRGSASATAFEPVLIQWIADQHRSWGKPEKAAEWVRKLPPEELEKNKPQVEKK